MTAEATPPPADAAAFRVEQPGYRGDLSGLAHALRSGTVAPSELDLPSLVDAALAWFERRAATDLNDASTALPLVAQVIEVKLRLLLPKAPDAADDEEEDPDDAASDAVEAVALLEELEQAIEFLRRRRQERASVLPARAERPELPRPSRPMRANVATLAKLASHLKGGSYFEMSRDRLTIEDAGRALRGALGRWVRGALRTLVPTRSWAERTVVFAAFLETVREGRAEARQERPYGAIEVEARERR